MKYLIQNKQNKTWFEILVQKEEKKYQLLELKIDTRVYEEENPEKSRTDGINFVQNLLNTQTSQMGII